ncbi:MAG: AAA family ATPase [Acidimicrobiales bacterium]
MRLETLTLEHFGHLRDHRVALGTAAGALRFVVGPNEAGKSTIRAGVRAALFGVTGASVQGTPKAAVRLRLDYTSGVGDPGQLVRHGGREPRDAHGRVIDADELAKLLEVTPELFDTLFSLGHHELRAYGSQLLQADGSLGAILFGAALGGRAVHDTLEVLQRGYEALFAPKAKRRRINELLADLREAETELEAVAVSADTWAELTDARRHALGRLDELRRAKRAVAAERQDIQRLRTIAPLLAKRAGLEHQLATLLAAGPVATSVQAQAIGAALDGRSGAVARVDELRAEVDRVRRQRDEVPADDSALGVEAEIEHLAERLTQLRTDLADIDRLDRALADAPSASDLRVLREAMTDTEGAAAALDGLAEADRRLASLDADIATRLTRLGLAASDRDEVLTLDVPTEAAIDEARSGDERRRAQRQHLLAQLDETRRQVDATTAQLTELRAGGDVPSIEHLHGVRAERDQAWALARARLVGEAHPDDDPARSAQEVADLVAGRIAAGDAVVDDLLADTDRATQLGALQATEARLRSEAARLEGDLDTLDSEGREAARSWTGLWRLVGSVPEDPGEGVAWRSEWVKVCELIASWHQVAADARTRRDAVSAAAERIRVALAGIGETVGPDAALPSLRARAHELLTAADERRADEARLGEAKRRVAEVGERLEPLRPLLGSAAHHRADDAIAALRDLRDRQRHDRQLRDDLSSRLEQLGEQLQVTGAEHDRHQHELDALARQLGVDADALPTVRERSAQVVELRRQLDDNEALVVESGGGLGLEELVDRSRAAGDDAALAGRLADLDEQLHRHDADIERFSHQLGQLEVDLDRIDGGDAATDIEARRQEILAELGEAVEEYAVLRVAHGLLERVVADAGSGRHDQLLARASHYFAVLTNGSYTGLEVETHGDQNHAVALRADGSRLYPAALSDGTLDQLWLALRLAGIEHHLDSLGAVPVVVDDVLVHFDDHRSSAALEALGELAQHTQVVVLTHHPHTVELARACLGDDRVAVTELASRSAEAPATVTYIGRADAAASSPPPVPAPPPGAPAARRAGSDDPSAARPPDLADDDRDRVARALSTTEWRAKSEVLELSGVHERRWGTLIRSLVDDGVVEQDGIKRGARYRLVPTGDQSSENGG